MVGIGKELEKENLESSWQFRENDEKPENPPFPVLLTRFYQRFTNIFGEPDLLLSRIHTMKSETERVCVIRLTKMSV